MKDETYGMRILERYCTPVIKAETDLVGAAFQVAGFRESYSKMNAEERNNMRDCHFYRDPQVDAWVYMPAELKLDKVTIIEQDST